MSSGTRVAAFSELVAGAAVKVEVDGFAVTLVRIGDGIYALADRCSHADASLSEGDVYEDDMEIECPLHGSTFDLETGEPQSLPATAPVAVYEAEVDADGAVWLTRREEPA